MKTYNQISIFDDATIIKSPATVDITIITRNRVSFSFHNCESFLKSGRVGYGIVDNRIFFYGTGKKTNAITPRETGGYVSFVLDSHLLDWFKYRTGRYQLSIAKDFKSETIFIDTEEHAKAELRKAIVKNKTFSYSESDKDLVDKIMNEAVAITVLPVNPVKETNQIRSIEEVVDHELQMFNAEFDEALQHFKVELNILLADHRRSLIKTFGGCSHE